MTQNLDSQAPMGTLKALGWGLKGKKWRYLKRILNSAMWEQKKLRVLLYKTYPTDIRP